MTVSELMTEDVITVPPTTSISEARALMRKQSIHHLVVTRGAHVLGVVSSRDLARVDKTGTPKTVAEVMTRHVFTIDGNAPLGRASYAMRGRSIGCLVVLRQGQIAGIITTADLIDQLGNPLRRKLRAEARTALHHRVTHRHRARADGVW